MTGVELDIPVIPELQAILSDTPRRAHRQRGRHRSPKVLGWYVKRTHGGRNKKAERTANICQNKQQ
jgi:hypothetical protein